MPGGSGKTAVRVYPTCAGDQGWEEVWEKVWKGFRSHTSFARSHGNVTPINHTFFHGNVTLNQSIIHFMGSETCVHTSSHHQPCIRTLSLTAGTGCGCGYTIAERSARSSSKYQERLAGFSTMGSILREKG